MSVEMTLETFSALRNTHQTPYVTLADVLLNGNDSMIAYTVSQIDLWHLQGNGYVLQKSCYLDEERHYMLKMMPDSNIVCLTMNFNISTLILYDVSSCTRVFVKTFRYSHISDIQISKNHVFVDLYPANPQLFRWNGSDLQPVLSISRNYEGFSLVPTGVLAYYKDRRELRFFDSITHRSSKLRTEFEFDSYKFSPDGRYVVFSYGADEYSAVYNIETKRLVSYGSVEVRL